MKISERWNIMMGLIGSHESKSGRLASINISSKGEETKEKCDSERDSNLLILLCFSRHAILICLDISLADTLMN